MTYHISKLKVLSLDAMLAIHPVLQPLNVSFTERSVDLMSLTVPGVRSVFGMVLDTRVDMSSLTSVLPQLSPADDAVSVWCIGDVGLATIQDAFDFIYYNLRKDPLMDKACAASGVTAQMLSDARRAAIATPNALYVTLAEVNNDA